MRESNFAFPAQNRACVCISSQLYDRRGTSIPPHPSDTRARRRERGPALDTNSSLPLFNSLTHLVYLTSTSPRIREIMTMDGGLERLVRILHDFCISPPPPENPAIFYGLAPPGSHPSKPVPTLLPKSYDKHAAYRFSLAFQCIVNIGVRGSEPIRSRVVQAGTLEVVGCILEAWLASKGFPVGPTVAANGMPRETREQRAARRQAALAQRQREQAVAIARALERQIAEQPTIRSSPVDISLVSSADTSREVRLLPSYPCDFCGSPFFPWSLRSSRHCGSVWLPAASPTFMDVTRVFTSSLFSMNLSIPQSRARVTNVISSPGTHADGSGNPERFARTGYGHLCRNLHKRDAQRLQHPNRLSRSTRA